MEISGIEVVASLSKKFKRPPSQPMTRHGTVFL
jgi:hypothetical protein